jgi:16S rRNA processing protein RimM
MSNNAPPLVVIGKIVRSHGLRGTVKVRPVAGAGEQFSLLRNVQLQRGAAALGAHAIESLQVGHDGIFIKFREVNDRTGAELLRGAELMIAREECLPAAPNQFYQFEIIGLPVFTTSGAAVGEIAEVVSYPANDVWVIRSGAEEKLIPAIDAVVQSVDLSSRRVIISSLPGLLEDEP